MTMASLLAFSNNSNIDKVAAGIGSPPIPTGTLAEAAVGSLLDRFVGQGA